MQKKRIAVALAAGTLLGFTGMSGSADARRCGGQPDGYVDLNDVGTWASPGEVVSFINSDLSLHATGAPGVTVKLFCGGAPG